MVLEETYSNAEPFIDSDVPASDSDRFSGTSNAQYFIAQPKPHEILVNLDLVRHERHVGSFLSSGVEESEGMIKAYQLRCARASDILRRPLRQEEAEAFCQNASHAVRMYEIGQPVALLGTMGTFYVTRRTGSMPFWNRPFKEGSKFSPDKFLFIRGSVARLQWSLLRFGAHGIAWSFATALFFGSYARAVELVHVASDQRLKDYNVALRQRAAEQAEQRSKSKTDQEQTSTTQNETFEQRRQRRSVQEAARRSGGYDDASPTGGSPQADYYDSGASDFVSDAQASQGEAKQNWEPGQAEIKTENASIARAPVRQATQDEFDTMVSSPTKQAPTGSAWDRLRQQALNEQSANQKQPRDDR